MSYVEKILISIGSVLCLMVAVLGIHFVFTESVTDWFRASAILWIAAMLISMALAVTQGFFAVIFALFSVIVVGRLYGTLRLLDAPNVSNDPLLLAETGPGVPSVMWACTALAGILVLWLVNFVRTHRIETPWGAVNDESWGLFFIRNYVGLMFIAHFSGHIFAGPAQFAIFEGYFGSIGLKPAAVMVTLAGVAELAAGIGLCLGLFTRFAALIGASFLYLSMLWGNHFPVGYIWILPTGGWEFGIFWAVIVACFIVLGGGSISLDQSRKIARS